MIQKALKIVKPIIVAAIGVYAANVFNIFEYISFIPKDNAYSLCITAYFTIIELLFGYLMDVLRSKCGSEISVTFFLNENEPTIDSTPVIKFNSSDLAEVGVDIKIAGRKKHFSKSELIISDVGFATMQPSIKNKIATIDTKGNCIINIKEMFGESQQKITSSTKFRLVFTKNINDCDRLIEIQPKLKHNNILKFNPLIVYKHNKSRLTTER